MLLNTLSRSEKLLELRLVNLLAESSTGYCSFLTHTVFDDLYHFYLS